VIENPFLVCSDLVKLYETAGVETVALQGLDLMAAPGELLAVIGPSGSGKTTLLNVLGGLDRPSAGQVWVDGQDLFRLSSVGLSRYRRAKVGFVWQESRRNLIPYLNGVENVRLPMSLAGRGGENQQAAEELLERVGLWGERYTHIAQLTMEQQQLVATAAALANGPKLLLTDEPAGGLDSGAAHLLYRTIQQASRDLNVTGVIASHDPLVANYADRVVAIRDGQVVAV
jgi:putative ABC transport system ATP-binding protein